MMYLAGGIEQTLVNAFEDSPVSFKRKSNYVILKNSQNQLERKVRETVKSAGFCPLMSSSRVNDNIVFSIVPYQIPECFNKENDSLSSNGEKTPYFNFDEMTSSLQPFLFVNRKPDEVVEDKWLAINKFRSFFSSSLKKGLSEIISKAAKEDLPIVEIGSGIGYALEENLELKRIRTQPDEDECQLLAQSISASVYEIDIEGICRFLLRQGKKVPLFFALNVFDTLPVHLRKASFLKISQLQNVGDRILILLDTNPYLSETIEQLEILYPGHAVYPYFPPMSEPMRFSGIIVPLKLLDCKPSKSEFYQMTCDAFIATSMGINLPIQSKLHTMQKEFGLKVIDLEGFFTGQIKNELEQAGYKTHLYYHTSFTTGIPPKKFSSADEDLIYKAVADPMTVRQWFLTDKRLSKILNKKGIYLPSCFNEDFLRSNRERGEKIFGAEILVIEGTKI